MTGRTFRGRHVIEQVFAIVVRGRLFQHLLQIAQNSRESGLAAALRLTVKQQALNFVGQLFKRSTKVKSVRSSRDLQHALQILRARSRSKSAFQQRL